MATFVVCTRCGKVQEITGIDQLPDSWLRSSDDLLCPSCTANGEVLDEEVIYPPGDRSIDDTFDEAEGYCEVCDGPCQGH